MRWDYCKRSDSTYTHMISLTHLLVRVGGNQGGYGGVGGAKHPHEVHSMTRAYIETVVWCTHQWRNPWQGSRSIQHRAQSTETALNAEIYRYGYSTVQYNTGHPSSICVCTCSSHLHISILYSLFSILYTSISL